MCSNRICRLSLDPEFPPLALTRIGTAHSLSFFRSVSRDNDVFIYSFYDSQVAFTCSGVRQRFAAL